MNITTRLYSARDSINTNPIIRIPLISPAADGFRAIPSQAEAKALLCAQAQRQETRPITAAERIIAHIATLGSVSFKGFSS